MLPWNGCVSVSDVTTKNPFPGMNPFFEQQWRDAHSSIITYLRDALQERLPSDLVVRAEEELVSIGAGHPPTTYRPDVQVREPWRLKEPGATAVVSASPPLASEPIRVLLGEEIERWLEIHDQSGRLVTALELLSPTNKLDSTERDSYLRKQREFMRRGANLVEIDLVRQGTWLFPLPVRRALERAGATYGINVWRATRPSEQEV